VEFFNRLFSEIQRIDFDEGFQERGKWCPQDGSIMMPQLVAEGGSEPGRAISVPVLVDRRIKPMNNAMWVARTSTHSEAYVKFSELGELLSQDHSRNEAVYTPSVYDANELLSWDREDLLKAVRGSNHGDRIQSVEMAGMFSLQGKLVPVGAFQSGSRVCAKSLK
jgi:hypothetical protein